MECYRHAGTRATVPVTRRAVAAAAVPRISSRRHATGVPNSPRGLSWGRVLVDLTADSAAPHFFFDPGTCGALHSLPRSRASPLSTAGRLVRWPVCDSQQKGSGFESRCTQPTSPRPHACMFFHEFHLKTVHCESLWKKCLSISSFCQ